MTWDSSNKDLNSAPNPRRVVQNEGLKQRVKTRVFPSGKRKKIETLERKERDGKIGRFEYKGKCWRDLGIELEM
nr:hypothetical protein Iba_chr12bCG1050 [Ipomoea batatas]GME21186.1 hypothetical protein Iba_scaffold27112CG0040 [Ipomoea batatas]